MNEAIPWYRSPVFVGVATAILAQLAVVLPKVAAALGLTSPDAINHSVNAIFDSISLAATAYAAIKRVKAPIQPLTTTQAKADVHPATIKAQDAATHIE